MLNLTRLEVEGFGPFADLQIIEFPTGPGITVIYGENMRGKTSLLNAIRYAFFGTVLGRSSRVRRLHTISNRELATLGKFGFSVALFFEHDGQEYELVRECLPRIAIPESDADYDQRVRLRCGTMTLGPQERDRILQQIFPSEVSRFFLFDGELLQEYEELLISESDSGHRISEAVERILGVPIIKRGRMHLTQLSEDADKLAAREASKHTETQGLGNSLQQATEQREAHKNELTRLNADLQVMTDERAEIERYLQSVQKYSSILNERDDAATRVKEAARAEIETRTELQKVMATAWRSLLRDPVSAARESAQTETEKALNSLRMAFRAEAASAAHCGICEQDLDAAAVHRLRESVAGAGEPSPQVVAGIAATLAQLGSLGRFIATDSVGEVRLLWTRLQSLRVEQVVLEDKLKDLNTALSDADASAIRGSRASYAEILEKITIQKRAIEEQTQKIAEKDNSIQNLKRRIDAAGKSDVLASQARARLLRNAAEVFSAAVERYKSDLRKRVETTASELFLSMTTEKHDYAGLTINESYGLTIRHKDGHPEDARSAGAEHVVALALMGALQRNAPLRGPIVMDSPFGRLDDGHTSNVVQALPLMADQVVLLVYEGEVGRSEMRDLLGGKLLREYQLDKISARRTNIVPVR